MSNRTYLLYGMHLNNVQYIDPIDYTNGEYCVSYKVDYSIFDGKYTCRYLMFSDYLSHKNQVKLLNRISAFDRIYLVNDLNNNIFENPYLSMFINNLYSKAFYLLKQHNDNIVCTKAVEKCVL